MKFGNFAVDSSAKKPQLPDPKIQDGRNHNNLNGTINGGFIQDKDEIVLQIDNSIGDDMTRYKAVPGKKDLQTVVKQRVVHEYSVRNTVIGCLLALSAAFMLAVGQGCIQLLDGAVGDFQLVAMRTFFQGWIGATFFIRKRKLPSVNRNQWIWLFLLCFCAVSVNLMFGIGIRYIPAGISACVRRCTEVIAMTLLSSIILRELLTPIRAACVGLCLGGVVMLIQPWYKHPVEIDTFPNATILPGNTSIPVSYSDSTFDLNSTEPTIYENEDGSGLSEEIVGYILVTVAGLMSANVTLIQKNKLMNINAWTMNLFIGIFGFTVTGTISLITENITFPTDVEKVIYITIQEQF